MQMMIFISDAMHSGKIATRFVKEEIFYEKYVHYGTAFNRSEFNAVTNRVPNPFDLAPTQKPLSGGFWASPVESEFGWADWCETEEFYLNGTDLGEAFLFSLREDAKVLVVDSEEKFRALPQIRGKVDFEALAMQYDALHVPCSWEMQKFFQWDCDSILVFNPDVVVPEH